MRSLCSRNNEEKDSIQSLHVRYTSEEMESERVKMESRGKLGNDDKVKFVGPKKKCEIERKNLWTPGYM